MNFLTLSFVCTSDSQRKHTASTDQLQSGLAIFCLYHVEDNIVEVEVTSLRSRQVLSNHAIERITTFKSWVARRLRNVDIIISFLQVSDTNVPSS